MATKFIDHFLWIAKAMNQGGPEGMWDEEDGFYYDVLRYPDGRATRLKVRSMVGLLPLCATTVIEPWQRERVPRTAAILRERLERMPRTLRLHSSHRARAISASDERGMAALVNPDRLRRILSRVLDENEFLSPYGIRALSRFHADHPYLFTAQGREYRVGYLPAESDSGMFGGNSNWRGPVWMPVNALLIRALLVVLSLLWRQFQDRVSHRLRYSDEPVRSRPRNRLPADPHFLARPIRPASRLRRL